MTRRSARWPTCGCGSSAASRAARRAVSGSVRRATCWRAWLRDIEALDGLYLRILVPLAGAVLLLPVLVVLIGVHSIRAGHRASALLFAVAAFVTAVDRRAAWRREPASAGGRDGALRIAALDALTGLREVRAFGAEGRMLAAVQAREATLLAAQRELASRTAVGQGGRAFLCGQVAILAVLIAAGAHPAAAVVAAVSGRCGVRGGRRTAARRRACRPCRGGGAPRAGGGRGARAGA